MLAKGLVDDRSAIYRHSTSHGGLSCRANARPYCSPEFDVLLDAAERLAGIVVRKRPGAMAA
jgi:hypothetical protein